jgi:hypothetical protein
MNIDEIGLDDSGALYIRPSSGEDFEHIYRSASGIRWNNALRTLHAYEPHRWAAPALFREILRAVAGEYGVALTIGPSTTWINIPDTLKDLILTAG